MASLNRIVMQRASRDWLNDLPLDQMEAAEISGKHGRRFAFKSDARYRYPKHDICDGPYLDEDGLVQKFDIILANQVWEHLDRPYRATRNVLRMLRVGGFLAGGALLHPPPCLSGRLFALVGAGAEKPADLMRL